MKKKIIIGFTFWNIVICLVIALVVKSGAFREVVEVQELTQEGTEEAIPLTQDDELIFQFQNQLTDISNVILKFGECSGHSSGELSVRIYDDKEEYYTYSVPINIFQNNVFYLYTNALQGLEEKQKYFLQVSVTGLGEEQLFLYCSEESCLDIVKSKKNGESYSRVSPFWGISGLRNQLSEEFENVFWIWLVLDVFFVAGVLAVRKKAYVPYGILLFLLGVTFWASWQYGEEVKEERTYEYWTHRNVAEFVNIPVKNGEIKQTFRAGYDDLAKFILLFDNYSEKDNAKLFVCLEDEQGDIYYNWSADLANLSGEMFCLIGTAQEELEKGKDYLLSIYLDSPYSEVTVRAVSQEDMHSSLKSLSVAGEELEATALYLFQSYRVIFSYDRLWWGLLIVTLLLFLAILYCKEELCRKVWKTIRLPLLLLVSYYNIENLSGNLYALETKYALVNCILILGLYLIMEALLLRKAYYIAAVMTLTAGLTNFYVLAFRGSEFILSDIKSFVTAMSVVGNYEFTIPAVVYTSVLLTACLVFVQAMVDGKGRKEYRKAGLPKRAAIGAVGVTILLILSVPLDANNFNFFNLSPNFPKYGWCYSNLYLVKFSSVEKPGNYSDKQVEKILSQLEEVETEAVMPKNLIVIMNESFSDLQQVGQLETNQDYLPFIRSLSENTIKGNLHVSTFGGNTSITEYEFLTGNTQHFLPAGSVPYSNVCEASEEGLAKILQAQNYYTVAMHPYGATNWKRDEVYPAMGFDDFLSLEDYEGTELIRNYVSDKADYQKIIDYYESFDRDQNLFIFNVTMQNHGGYDINNGVIDATVKIENFDSAVGETYLSLIYESDKAFEYLLSYFSGVEEPTMIVMFGDHLPALPDSFYESLYGKKLDELGTEEEKRQYMTPYIIWTNYASDFEPLEDVSANYLGSVVLQYAGLELPEYNQFLLEKRKQVPVIGNYGIYDAQGNYILYENVSEELLNDYQILQYMRIKDRNSQFYDIFKLNE